MSYEEKPSLDEALMHFGVKGMKWGQHKSQASVSPSQRAQRRSTASNVGLVAASVVGGPFGFVGYLAAEHVIKSRLEQQRKGRAYLQKALAANELNHPLPKKQ